MADKIRLDAAVVAKGIAESREKAKALIMAGNIFIGRERMDKPGVAVPAVSYTHLDVYKRQVVKDAVQNMTGVMVAKVNVFVAGIGNTKPNK